MRFHLEGVIPALLTPFSRNGEKIDYQKACALADRLAKQGVHGIFPCGTTGEGALMTLDERKTMIEELVRAVGKKIKVIAQTGCFDTASTIELTRHAMETGAAAAGIVTPGFFGFDDEALLKHFTAVASAVQGFPILLYNIPGCAKNVISPELLFKACEKNDNIVGMKDSSGNMVALTQVLAGMPKGFNLINGVDEYTFQALVAGANGSVSSTANVVPELFLHIFNNVRKGNLKKAWEAQVKLARACTLFQYGRMAAFYKEGLRLRGFDVGCVRPPQRELNKAERRQFEKGFKESAF